MSVRDVVLHQLANVEGDFISGEELAAELGVSRAAVWKAVQRLQEEGYAISGTRNRGYALDGVHDLLTECGIREALDSQGMNDAHFILKDVTGSTNDDARELVARGAPEFTTVIASSQTGGKGRRGRAFYSPSDAGVYLSIIVRPRLQLSDAWMLTGAAAVAVCNAIGDTIGESAQIKWVNDVYFHNRKVCGILTEGVADLESGGLTHAIVGIGVDVYEPRGGYPEEIAGKAGFLSDERKGNLRNQVAASVVAHFAKLYKLGDPASLVGAYQSLSMMPGKCIMVERAAGESRSAVAEQVNDDMSLRVRYEDGIVEDLKTGEVSIVMEHEG